MSEYAEVEQPFLQQLAKIGWTIIDQGSGEKPRTHFLSDAYERPSLRAKVGALG
jgi:hypothetical protein